MLEGEEYCNVDIVFPFVARFIDEGTGFSEEAPKTPVHSSCSKLVGKVMDLEGCLGSDISSAECFSNEVKEFKELAKKKFSAHRDCSVYILKLHL